MQGVVFPNYITLTCTPYAHEMPYWRILIRLPEFLYSIICVSCDTSKFEGAFKDGDDSEQNLFGEK